MVSDFELLPLMFPLTTQTYDPQTIGGGQVTSF